MGVGIYYFYHGFGLKAFEGRHIRILINSMLLLSIQPKLSLQYKIINSANIKKTEPISILA